MKQRLARALGQLRGSLSGGNAYPIGLQLGRDRLNLVQMRPTPAGPPAFRAAASLDYGCTRDEFLAHPRRLKTLLKRAFVLQPFSGKRVVACMPEDKVKVVLVNFSVSEGQSDADAIVREMRERMKGNSDGAVIDYMLVRREDHRGKQREAIVAMAAREQVTGYLDFLSGAGLHVAALDIGPMALARIVSWIASPDVEPPPNLLLINFGSLASYLTVVWGRRLMLDRGIEFSGERLVARVATLMGMPQKVARQLLSEHGFAAPAASDEANELGSTLKEVLRPEFAALAAEVSKTMRYTASKTHGRAVDRIYVTGGITRYAGFVELLKELLSMPVETLDPFSLFAHRLDGKYLASLTPHSRLALPTGLALRNVNTPWPNLT
jgi:type IV pilus assembly protein PilM